jgi:hypothetical protein
MKQYSIVGQKHRGLDPYLAGTLPGVPVTLVREPMNQYDPIADLMKRLKVALEASADWCDQIPF